MKNPCRAPTRAKVSAATAPAIAVEQVDPSTPNSCGPEKVPPQWAWHHRTLLHLRNRTQRVHNEHSSQANTAPENDTNDTADLAQSQADRDLLWAELGAENDKLFEIDCALQRIRDGLYGCCEVTAHAIPPERLRALPWTRYCGGTAAAHEARVRSKSARPTARLQEGTEGE